MSTEENYLTISPLPIKVAMGKEMREKLQSIKAEHNFVVEIEAAVEKFCSEYNVSKEVAVMLLVTGARIGAEYTCDVVYPEAREKQTSKK
jgi:hypothetical protein